MSVLLQVSDTHFGTEQPAVMQALAALVRQQAPNLLVLSGDITQRARPTQFRAARSFIDSLATPFLALPSTLIFVALQEGRIVGTISVVVDGPAGLPMETIYGKEVAALRAQGRRIAEVGALCVTPGLRGFGVPFLLNKAMGLSARDVARVDDLVIAVHPRAHDLYRALLGFETMGPIREYPSLKKSALAVGLRLPLREAQESYRARYGDRVAKANPYYLYFQRRDPQIVFPTDEAGLERVRQVHRRAAVKLLAMRPDVLIDLSTDSFGIVSRALGSPGPADDSQR